MESIYAYTEDVSAPAFVNLREVAGKSTYILSIRARGHEAPSEIELEAYDLEDLAAAILSHLNPEDVPY